MAIILLIEDNAANRILVERILSAENHTMLSAVDGATGIDLAVSARPDLLLVDMGLPDIDGQTVVSLLKQMPETQDIPMVAITAWPAETAFETAERYGLSGCILKPIDVKAFPQQILEFLGDKPRAVNDH